MRKIYSGIIYDIVPKSNGVVFFCREESDSPVCVKMLSVEDGKMIDVGLSVYANCKMGVNCATVVKYCNNYVLDHILSLNNSEVFVCTQEGNAFLLDAAGEAYWSGEMKYRENSPSGIALYKNSIWASFRDTNVILRFNLNTMRSELRIGGKQSPFDGPTKIYVDGDTAIVCNEKSKNLAKVNFEDYTVETYKQFDEPVHQYLKVGKYEFVALSSGLYVI